MATLARLQKRLAQAEDRKNRRVFLSTKPVEVQKVVDDRQERLEKAEYLQIFVDPSPYAPMAEVSAGSHTWMLTGINHALKSWSRRGEPTYVFSEVDDLHPDAFYAVIFPRDTDEEELEQLESILQRFTMYHISDRKKEPSNPFLPDPDQVIGAVAKGIGNILGLGGSKHSSSKQQQQRSREPSPDRRTPAMATSAPGGDSAYPARDYNAWQAREVARGYGGVQNQEGWGGGRGGAGDWDDRRDRDQARERSTAYPWDAVGGASSRDTRPAAHLHHQDATVGQDSYNPRFDTPGVQPAYRGSRQQPEEGGWGRGSVPGSNRLQLSDRDRQEAAARVAALKEQLNEGAGLPSAPPVAAKEPGWLNTDSRQAQQQQRGYPSAAAAAPYGSSDDWGSGRDQYRGGGSKYGSSKEMSDEDKEIQLLRGQAADAREAWQAALKNMEAATTQRQEEEARRARERQRRDKTPNWQKVMAGLFSAGVPVYNQPDL